MFNYWFYIDGIDYYYIVLNTIYTNRIHTHLNDVRWLDQCKESPMQTSAKFNLPLRLDRAKLD